MNEQTVARLSRLSALKDAQNKPTGIKLFLMMHGFKIFLVGFGFTTLGIFTLIAAKDTHPVYHTIGLCSAFGGFALYVIGRIGHMMDTAARKKALEQLKYADDTTTSGETV